MDPVNGKNAHVTAGIHCHCVVSNSNICSIFSVTAYSKTHLRFGFTCSTGQSTARIASSNTVFRPFWVNALHSRYFTAPISFAMARPCERRMSLQIMNVVCSSGMLLNNVSDQGSIHYISNTLESNYSTGQK